MHITKNLSLLLKKYRNNRLFRYNKIKQTKTNREEPIVIYRQLIIQDIELFTSQPKAKFYDKLFFNLDLFEIRDFSKRGRKGYSKKAMICAFILMKCEDFTTITDLIDYLTNNLIIAYYCGFDISKSLPSHTFFERFIKNFDNNILKNIMIKQVAFLAEKGIIDTSFIGLDSTPISANTTKNNPKSFVSDKFNPDIHPTADEDCKLGGHTASNQTNEKKYTYYWGYKNHVLVDYITGLPIYKLTTTANVADSTVAVNILDKTNAFLSLKECSFLADKEYDVNAIYDKIAEFNGSLFIPLNKGNSKSHKTLLIGNVICDAGLAMHKDGKFSDNGRTRQKYCCPFKNSKNGICPCNHKNFNNGKKNKGCTKYQTLSDTIRLSIDRDCSSFKKTYSLRTECERYNSRFKATGQERMWVRNIKSVSNLNTISHICLLAVTVASIQNDKSSYRKLKTLKRIS